MNKARSLIMTLLIGFGFVVLVGMYCQIKTLESKVVYIYITDPNIPSVWEIQQKLKDLDDPRYDPGKVDGIPGPKTIRGWDNHTCDRYAKRAIKGR